MTDLHSPSSGSSCKSSFESGSKSTGRLVVGDTRHAEMFVRDNLTSGFVPPASLLAGIFDGQHGGKPLSKYDPNTGKFYRSVALDAESIPASLSALSLLSLFASDEMRYNTSTHTGVVINLAGQITVTCVGDTHVQTDALYTKVQETLASLFSSQQQLDNGDGSDGIIDSVMGISLVQCAGKGPVEKDCELEADSSLGFTLFSRTDGKLCTRHACWKALSVRNYIRLQPCPVLELEDCIPNEHCLPVFFNRFGIFRWCRIQEAVQAHAYGNMWGYDHVLLHRRGRAVGSGHCLKRRDHISWYIAYPQKHFAAGTLRDGRRNDLLSHRKEAGSA
jgi:hypothetical protein